MNKLYMKMETVKWRWVMMIWIVLALVIPACNGHAYAQSQKAQQAPKKDPAIVFTPDGYVVMPREYFDNHLKQRAKQHEEKLKLWKEIEQLEEAIQNAKCS